MRLYYLTEQRWAEKILAERRLKLAQIESLNDPFELLGVAMGEKRIRRIVQALHHHNSKATGLLCMTTDWRSPVMWAHYGHKHQGVCLGFDVVEAEVHRVRYELNRLKGSLLDGIGPGNPMTAGQLTALLTTKFAEWKYEREWRIFARLDTRTPENGLYYLNFFPHLQLRDVILGARCEATLQQFAERVPPSAHAVEVFKARAAFDSFRIVRQQAVKPIIVPASYDSSVTSP